MSRELAKKLRPCAIWIDGDGKYASVSDCMPGPTIILFAELEEAEKSKAAIDHFGCTGKCSKIHSIVCLED